jgi:BirA family biotin operon repressor/biotin-[acetyl-CoA-carboxylase] ligase
MPAASTPIWRVTRHDEVGSTNDLAGKLPGWHAVVAKRQLQGRGRYRRSWVSDEGGIWFSAVLPTDVELLREIS